MDKLTDYEVIWYDDDGSGSCVKRIKTLSVTRGPKGVIASAVVQGAMRTKRFTNRSSMADIIRGMWGGGHGYWYKPLN